MYPFISPYVTLCEVITYYGGGGRITLATPRLAPPPHSYSPNRHCALIALREINLDFCAAFDSRTNGSEKYFSNVTHAKNNSFRRCDDVFLFKPPSSLTPHPQRPLSATHKALPNSFLLCNVSLFRSTLKEKDD